VRGNGRLIVVSPGSGGSPWVHSDLARALVESGFVVAVPSTGGDNYKDLSAVGPESWKRRPAEMSRANRRCGTGSALRPASRARQGRHVRHVRGRAHGAEPRGRPLVAGAIQGYCEAHIAEDFYSCVGLATRLNGDFLDGMKKTIALAVIRWRFEDATLYAHADRASPPIVAGVPYAADFDMGSLAAPRVPLALVTARQDKWLLPRFHSDRVLKACAACERLGDFPSGGHGALLSPLPPGRSGVGAELMNDPPGFDRSALPGMNRRIAAFFRKHLLP